MYTSNAVVLVQSFQGKKDTPAKPDKNGKMPVILVAVAGQVPSIGSVLSGTVAERAGLVVGKTHVVTFSEREADATYGRRINVANLGEVGPLEAVKAAKDLGAAEVVQLSSEIAAEATANNQAASAQ